VPDPVAVDQRVAADRARDEQAERGAAASTRSAYEQDAGRDDDDACDLRRGRRPARTRSAWKPTAAYLLVLLALRRASAPSVAAVRETGVVIAAVLAAIFLHERVGIPRFAGAVLVVGGIALLAAG